MNGKKKSSNKGYTKLVEPQQSEDGHTPSKKEIAVFLKPFKYRKINKNPDRAIDSLSSAHPKLITSNKVFQELEKARGKGQRHDVLAGALTKLASKSAPDKDSKIVDRGATRDPELFEILAKQLNPEVWNDKGLALGDPRRGLGARVCNGLWQTGGYEEICMLIKHGVDTTIPVQDERRGAPGNYSGFVMPLQHQLQEYLPDIELLETEAVKDWSKEKLDRTRGAKMIFQVLEEEGKAVTLTNWSDIKNSEVIEEFQKKPGTIWGFENIRAPYARAAQETEQGVRPVRMMDLWPAIQDWIGDRYESLLDDPVSNIPVQVEKAVKLVGEKVESDDRYKHFRGEKKNTYLEELRKSAIEFLTELREQIPRGSFARQSEEKEGVKRAISGFEAIVPIKVSEVAGIHDRKFMSSFACKAGLWWAKNSGEPIYYCLDGINMDDVIDYKKVKNKAVQKFIDDGGAVESEDSHREVVTMKEVREILRNWDEFSGVVKFFDKNGMIKGKALEEKVKDWQRRMEESKEEAGRTPAPPREQFKKDLMSIDPGLPNLLDQYAQGSSETEVNQDARDIVRKAGYLLKIANTRPDYTLKYLAVKCDVLAKYGLISTELIDASAAFRKLANKFPPVSNEDLKTPSRKLVAAIGKCNPNFQDPLTSSLVKNELVK